MLLHGTISFVRLRGSKKKNYNEKSTCVGGEERESKKEREKERKKESSKPNSERQVERLVTGDATFNFLVFIRTTHSYANSF